MTRASSNITVRDRFTAICAAKDLVRAMQDLSISQIMRVDRNLRSNLIDRAIFTLCRLGDVHVDRATIAHHLDAILAAELPPCADLAWLRLWAAKFRRALGLPAEPRSAAALAAYEDRTENGAWQAYIDSVRQPVAIEIPVAREEA